MFDKHNRECELRCDWLIRQTSLNFHVSSFCSLRRRRSLRTIRKSWRRCVTPSSPSCIRALEGCQRACQGGCQEGCQGASQGLGVRLEEVDLLDQLLRKLINHSQCFCETSIKLKPWNVLDHYLSHSLRIYHFVFGHTFLCAENSNLTVTLG